MKSVVSALVVTFFLGLWLARIVMLSRRGLHAGRLAAGRREPAPSPRGSAALRWLFAVLIWLPGNAVLWVILFSAPVTEHVPQFWIMFFGLLANFWLVPLARSAGTWIQRRLNEPSVPVK